MINFIIYFIYRNKNIYDVVNINYNTTLEKTNNKYWYVYNKEMDITFKVKKTNDLIKGCWKGCKWLMK